MISRRLLRIKTLQILFAFYRGENDSLAKVENELTHSINRAFDLYHYILLLLIDLRLYADNRIELARQKKMPTLEDVNPNTRFIDNQVIKLLEDNVELNKYLRDNKLSWANYPELIKKLYQKVTASKYYEKYMEGEETGFAHDKNLVIQILTKELAGFEDFEQCLEDQSIYWNDDLDFMAGMVVKTIKKFEENQPSSIRLFPLFRNEEDEDFAQRLLRKTVLKHDENVKVIDKFTKNWDVERIASMDILIMEMALTEILEFPSIPVKVTFNEYIEISKYYSTEQSSMFIKGILDKIIHTFREENRIQKQGRGLVGEDDLATDS